MTYFENHTSVSGRIFKVNEGLNKQLHVDSQTDVQ